MLRQQPRSFRLADYPPRLTKGWGAIDPDAPLLDVIPTPLFIPGVP